MIVLLLRIVSALICASFATGPVSFAVGLGLGFGLGPVGVMIMLIYAAIKKCEKA